jgi:hypothetical protein
MLVASAGPADTFYIGQRDFRIPIGFKEARRAEIKQVLLYLAAPDGKTWKEFGRTLPDETGFPFRAADDGAYLFKLAVINKTTGRQEPADIAHEGEARCIVVDTAPPVLRGLSAERQGDEVVVRWDLLEKNPDWATLKLEYVASDAPGAPWSRVAVAAPESQQASFHVDGPVHAVRLSVMDLAKNPSNVAEAPVKSGAAGSGIAVATGAAGAGGPGLPPLDGSAAPGPLPLPNNGDGGWSPTPPGGTTPAVAVMPKPAPRAEALETGSAGGASRPPVVAAAGGGGPAPAATPPHPARGPLPPVQMVKKRQVTIDYEVTKFGPSGIKSVELYVTRDDGRNWQRCDGEDSVSATPPVEAHGAAASLKRALTVELQSDGLYGFYLVVKSGAGLGKPPPQSGEPPQMRIEVDTTAPKADLFEPRPHPTRRDCLILSWTATDNKFGPTPITLQWAERPDGEWRTIGSGELPNTGEYVWQVPANIPPHVYLKLLARDLAGNESVAQTPQPILVDLNEPEVKPLQISANPR